MAWCSWVCVDVQCVFGSCAPTPPRRYIIWLFGLHFEFVFHCFAANERCKLFCWLIYFRPTLTAVARFRCQHKPLRWRQFSVGLPVAANPPRGALHLNNNRAEKNATDLFMSFHTGDSMHLPRKTLKQCRVQAGWERGGRAACHLDQFLCYF